MKFLRLLFITFFYLPVFGQINGLQIPFEEIFIQSDDGLQSWENIDIFNEDKEGVFWTAINEGIFRYNGHTAINVSSYLSTKYGLDLDSQTSTRVLKEDSVLWIGRRKSLLRLDLRNLTKKEIFLDSSLHPSNYRNYIRRLKSHKDTLYVGTGNGLYLVDCKTHHVLKKYLTDGIEWDHTASSNGLSSIYLDIENDAIWTALNSGLYRIDKKTDNIEKYTLDDPELKFKHHFLEGQQYNDELLFTAWGLGMVKFNLKTKTFKLIKNKPSINEKWSENDYWDNNITRSMIHINDSLSLINFQKFGNGYYNRDKEKFIYIKGPEELKQGVFFNVDRSGYLWVSKIGRLWRSKKPIVSKRKPFKHIIDISSFKANEILKKIPAIEGYDDINLEEERNISIEYTLTKPHLLDTIQYQYQLNNKKWTPVSKPNSLQLTNLKGRTHNLQLRALDRFQTVIATRNISFKINIPFHKTIYFKLLTASVLFGIAFFISNHFQSKRTTKKLKELDELKSNFFENISHEFRTPLSLIMGPVEQQLQKTDIDPAEKQNLSIAQRNTTRLLTLVDQLLDLSKLEAGYFKLKVQEGDLVLFLKSLTSSFSYLAQENNQNYKTTIDLPQKAYYFDPDALEKIVTNLISNALKYSPQEAHIHITANLQHQKLHLTVQNSGASLSKAALHTIFNRFERTDEQTAGTGIGLALSKELVALHKGIIKVNSDRNITTFTILLPIIETAFSDDEKLTGVIEIPTFAKAISSPQETTIKENDLFNKDTNPILLIIDDNADLRTYVSSLFETQYTIHTDSNGSDGFQTALSVVPDLIITDLMMPEDDGITFTQNCKTNKATSHIPVIMLTAKAGDENQLIGLETGADAYITKPFNTEILKTTIHNLLETRKKLQERFSQEVALIPKEMAVNTVDKYFLDNLKELIDNQLIESDFNVEAFAQALGMSRMQLHRKLKALTGLSATEFIRSQRLKLAAQLLKKSDINISQVGYAVGFNNHSYFTKCFKEQYGISPSDYAKKS